MERKLNPRTVTERLAEIGLLEDEEIELDEAALTLSIADATDSDTIDNAVHQLDCLELSVRINDGLIGTPTQMAQQLAEAISGRYGYTGNRDDYDNPRNADFAVLLDVAQGLPVTLAILYVVVARRFGVEAVPIGLPGHVVVRIGSGADAAYLDPFNDGDLVPREAPLLRGAVDAAVLGNRAVLVRLLTNQAARAHNAGDYARARTLVRRMCLFAPGFTSVWWERAQLEHRLGDAAAARDALLAMRETTHDAAIHRRIDATLAAWAR